MSWLRFHFPDVTTAMASHIIEGISSHSSLLDAYVILHATLVASLHKLVGIDFGA
jgi:nucleolar MIF4G domain-containing protein 1